MGNRHCKLMLAGLAALLSSAAWAADPRPAITIADTGVFPESMMAASDGTVWFGSIAKGTIYRAAPGASSASPWILSETSGIKRVNGLLADERTRTLWACASGSPAANGAPEVPTSVRALDISTGAAKGHYPFPGGGSCNDMALAPDGTLYATDFGGGRVLRLRPGQSQLEVWATEQAGVDGIALLADGAVYVNNFRNHTLLRIPVGADGSAGALVPISTSQPLDRPDGMRAVGPDTLLVAEGGGRLTELTINGNAATVRILKDGLVDGPVSTVLVGDTAFIVEGKFAKMRANPPQDPGQFSAIAVPYVPAR